MLSPPNMVWVRKSQLVSVTLEHPGASVSATLSPVSEAQLAPVQQELAGLSVTCQVLVLLRGSKK